MKYFLILSCCLFIASCKADQQSVDDKNTIAAYLRFDSNVPNDTPRIFAGNVLAPNGEHVGYSAFSPDGKDLYYAETNDHWSESRVIKISCDSLSVKTPLYLKDKKYEGEPFITRDGNKLYFMAVLPPANGEQWHADQYRAYRTTSGWSEPERLDTVINTSASEWHISATDGNIIYFTSEREEGTSALHGDIYRAEVKGDHFEDLIKLPSPINSVYNDSDPLIAPDESFLIFHSDRPGGFGQHDLYICFNSEGQWTNPLNMGPLINTAGWEMAPSLTPDGKYLLFTYRKAMVTDDPAKIFWVSLENISRFK